MKKKKFEQLPIAALVLIDALVLGLALIVFALYDHAWPRSMEAEVSDETLELIQQIQARREQEALSEEPMIEAIAGKFSDKFTDGDVVETKKSYMSSNANVSYDDFTVEIEGKKVVYHKVEIYVRNYEYFRTAIVGNTLVGGMNHASGTPYLARKKDAITAINGDYCSGHNIGPVVRNGVLYRTSAFDDIFVMYTDGSMKAYEKGTYADMNFESGDIWQAWSFGPSLLTADGQPKTEFNSVLTDLHPRTAIGYYEPGHYCFVTIDGRNSGGSRGMTLEEMSKLFYDFGCTAAYNLDGGRTSVAVWKDKIINNPYGGGRPCSDIVYIPKK